jgi:hypothetical protein
MPAHLSQHGIKIVLVWRTMLQPAPSDSEGVLAMYNFGGYPPIFRQYQLLHHRSRSRFRCRSRIIGFSEESTMPALLTDQPRAPARGSWPCLPGHQLLAQQEDENRMMEGRTCVCWHPANPRRCEPSQGVWGPPPSKPSPFCQYFLRSRPCQLPWPSSSFPRKRESRGRPNQLAHQDDENGGP